MAIKLSGGFQYKDFLYVSDVVNAIDCVIGERDWFFRTYEPHMAKPLPCANMQK